MIFKDGQPCLKPFFTFFGGKWRAAPRYPRPMHDTIIEPFAGAAGYSLRHSTRKIILVEKDPVVAALWRYLVNVSASEIRALPIFEMPRDQWVIVDSFNICAEAKTLIGFWVNKGTAAPCKRPSAWMRAGTHLNSFWGPVVRDRIAEQVEYIKHWRVIEGDYTAAPNVEATWFIDPPYQLAGKKYRCSSKDIDFAALAMWCRGRPGFAMVCENQGAEWLPFEYFESAKSNPSKRGKGRSEEVVCTMVHGFAFPCPTTVDQGR